MRQFATTTQKQCFYFQVFQPQSKEQKKKLFPPRTAQFIDIKVSDICTEYVCVYDIKTSKHQNSDRLLQNYKKQAKKACST